MGSELHGVPVSAAESAPPASPKALSTSTLSGIRAPLTVDNSDSDYNLSGDDDNIDGAYSGYESDTGSEIADPDDKILVQTHFVEEYVVSKPVVKIPGFEIDKRSSLDRNLEVDGAVKDGGASLVHSPRVSSEISSIISPIVEKNVVSKAVLKLPGLESDKRGSFGRNVEVFEGVVRTSVGEDENVRLSRLPRVSSGSGISSIISPVGRGHVVSKPVMRIPSFEISRSGSFDRNLGVLSRTPVGENDSLARSPSVSSGIASIISPVEEKIVVSKPVLKIPGFEIEKRSSFGRNLEVVVGTSAGGNGNDSLVRSPRLSVSSGISSIISPGPVGEKYVVSKPVLKTSGFVIEKISSFGRNLGVVHGVGRTSVDETESANLLRLPRVNSGSSPMVRPVAKVSSGSDDDDDDDDDFKSNVRVQDEPFLGDAGKFGSAPKVRNLDDYASDGESVKDITLVGDDKGPFVVEEARNVGSYDGIQESDLIPEENSVEVGDDGKTCDAADFPDEESIGSNVVEEVQQVPCGDVLKVEVAESREEVSMDYGKSGSAVSEGFESEIEQKTDQEQDINDFLEVEVVESKVEDNLEEASVDCGPSELDASEGLKSETELRTDQNLETNDAFEVEVAEGKARDNVEEAFVDYEKCGDENVNANGTVLQPCQFVACEEKSDQTLETAAQYMNNINLSDTKVFLEQGLYLAGNEIDLQGIDAGKSTVEEIMELEKLQEVVVKFLRLVHRLKKSPEDEDSGTAKILHQILLASGKSYPKSFNFDIAKKMALIIEEDGNDDSNFSLNVLVIGKSGVGKSATINSLFGEEKARTDAFELGTTSVRTIKGNLNGIHIQVLDTPGFSSSLADRKILSSIQKLIKKMPPDVVLYVDRLDTQVGDINDLPLFNLITAFLGSSIWSRTILTLTHAASGESLSYDDSFVSKKLCAVQELVRHSIGDSEPVGRIPVSLIENNLKMEENEQKSQLLVLCFAMKLLSDMERNAGYRHVYDYYSAKPLQKQVNEGHILLGISLKNPNSQLSVSLDSRLSVKARLDGKRRRSGVVCIRLGSSDQRLIAAFAFLPIAGALCRTVFMLLSQ